MSFYKDSDCSGPPDFVQDLKGNFKIVCILSVICVSRARYLLWYSSRTVVLGALHYLFVRVMFRVRVKVLEVRNNDIINLKQNI